MDLSVFMIPLGKYRCSSATGAILKAKKKLLPSVVLETPAS